MKVLLIGGTGVLSSDIRDAAIEKGHEVYILNRGINKVKNTNKLVKTIIADIRDKSSAKQALCGMMFDVVVDFISFTEEELQNTLSIVGDKCKQFIFISSATVYCKTKRGEKITENYRLDNAAGWEYAQNKIKCEKRVKDEPKKIGFKYTIVRPYVTYSDARIPFAIIPHNMHWSLADRIINGRPVVLWDGGAATCTLTYSKDFAVGFVGLFGNEKAYNEDFHITSDHTLTWKEALDYLANSLGVENAVTIDIPIEYICKFFPELRGELLGDKGLDREFDNTKIKNAVPEFSANTSFEEGIKYVIEFYSKNENMRCIDYSWDAKIDKMIRVYSKNNDLNNNKAIESIRKKRYWGNMSISDKIVYDMSSYSLTCMLYTFFRRACNKIKYTVNKKSSLRRK